jgi:hypothetical protein
MVHGPTAEEEPAIRRGFAAVKIAVVLDEEVKRYVAEQVHRLPQSKGWSALVRDLLREHQTLRATNARLQQTVTAQERRIRLLELALDRAKRP